MTLQCFLDQDGVIADLVGGACDAHKVINPYFDLANHGNYEMSELLGLTKSEFWTAFDEDFWANLPLMPDAMEFYELCIEYFGEQNIFILTSPPLNPRSASGKLMWIKRHFPRLYRRSILAPEKHVCSNPSAVLIDDADYNCEVFHNPPDRDLKLSPPGRAILVPRSWNSSHSLANRSVATVRDSLDRLFHDLQLPRHHER